MKTRYNPEEVAEIMGVDNNTLKLWRSPQRLKGGKANSLYLPVQTDPNNKNVVWYLCDDVLAFLQRNEKYAERVLSIFAPYDVRNAITPAPQPPKHQPYGLLAGSPELTT